MLVLQLWERFRPGQTPPQALGQSRDYNIDLVPKFIMAHGNLVRPPCLSEILIAGRSQDLQSELWQLATPETSAWLCQVRALVHTGVVKYMEFRAVDGSYVLNKGRVERVPATDYEALRSPLMGLFEKRRARNFFLCAPQLLGPSRSCIKIVGSQLLMIFIQPSLQPNVQQLDSACLPVEAGGYADTCLFDSQSSACVCETFNKKFCGRLRFIAP